MPSLPVLESIGSDTSSNSKQHGSRSCNQAIRFRYNLLLLSWSGWEKWTNRAEQTVEYPFLFHRHHVLRNRNIHHYLLSENFPGKLLHWIQLFLEDITQKTARIMVTRNGKTNRFPGGKITTAGSQANTPSERYFFLWWKLRALWRLSCYSSGLSTAVSHHSPKLTSNSFMCYVLCSIGADNFRVVTMPDCHPQNIDHRAWTVSTCAIESVEFVCELT